jgi:hypothetical protein
MNDERDEVFEDVLDAHVQGRSPSLENLDDTQRREIESLLRIADGLWDEAHGAPPLESDPVAAVLGLVPDRARSLDPRALQHATTAAGLKASTLAERLRARGWNISTRDVFNWHAKGSSDVSPALIQAIAEITGSTIAQLTIDRGPDPSRATIEAVVGTKRFKELAERWARLHRTTFDWATSALSARLATSVHRGAHPDEEQMLRSLEALVSALEAGAADENER